MTDAIKNVTAALAAILIAGTSMTAVVTVPPAESAPALASLATPDLA